MTPLPSERYATLTMRENALHKQGFLRVAGVDEAGRGPLAGPVVAAACVYTETYDTDVPAYLTSVYDSKKMTPQRRAEVFTHITAGDSLFHVGIGIADVDMIDRDNILRATQHAMRAAILNLALLPDYILVDGNAAIPDAPAPQEQIVRGDSTCLCIAAASIVAKETRDALMREYATRYPHYEFDTHKGYGTAAHIDALRKYGRCPLHRRSFRVAALDEKTNTR